MTCYIMSFLKMINFPFCILPICLNRNGRKGVEEISLRLFNGSRCEGPADGFPQEAAGLERALTSVFSGHVTFSWLHVTHLVLLSPRDWVADVGDCLLVCSELLWIEKVPEATSMCVLILHSCTLVVLPPCVFHIYSPSLTLFSSSLG